MKDFSTAILVLALVAGAVLLGAKLAVGSNDRDLEIWKDEAWECKRQLLRAQGKADAFEYATQELVKSNQDLREFLKNPLVCR